jgi:hypothetical protein
VKVKSKDGLLWSGKDFLEPVCCSVADDIARANGDVYAERFTKKYESRTLTLDPLTLKITNNKGV